MKQYQMQLEENISKFCHGSYFESYEIFGAYETIVNEQQGVMFTVWAPFVKSIQVIGDFNDWNGTSHYMHHIKSGVWQLFVSGVAAGALYKYLIETEHGQLLYKADPYAFASQIRPNTASKVCNIDTYKWSDGSWMYRRKRANHFVKPMNVYEVHMASWKRNENIPTTEEETPVESYYTYRQLAQSLVPYAKDMGYTHLELMSIMEHPYDGSWGYQVTGFFAPTARHGTPEDFMYFVDCCHKAGLGVILDWIPGHFCPDDHGLANFNGSMLYERSKHAQWGTYKFDYGRAEVRNFLYSSASFWMNKYHIDGIRVDGVTSMVYLNFGVIDEDLHEFNRDGGDHDLEAKSFLATLNTQLPQKYPGCITIAEESTALPLVTYPPENGGLGFHYKWDMGWMHDTLDYMEYDFPARPYHHNLLTFSMAYAFNENFVLALSHDEVVHGKKSLIGRMSGDYWRQFANMRLLHLYQMTHPGAKLNFMGNEIGQYMEWRYYEGIEWFLLNYENHNQYHQGVKALNHLFLEETALWEQNYSWSGFEWLDADNNGQSILIYKRQGKRIKDFLIVVLNFNPQTYIQYDIGVPKNCTYEEIFNSDLPIYGGSGKTNPTPLQASINNCHGQPYTLKLTIPPLGGVILKPLDNTKRKNTDK